ncbi:ATP synthase-coupling factor 6, mitochondrial-like [Varroa jacobsoni]|uniref:ATP synthase-coupling factor 6, mitochondrial n=1 Tax=Varroa destructor TaxID=109461 RepID=A0A7M7JAM4_VARDE|nr:ATP synthase-coupling factor 6, mitochondrial-like [Varroa destructor]XP_022700012.1 ATP synthase-coupling factor 6, mitochondrial-like [Varroa jacobsoni]
MILTRKTIELTQHLIKRNYGISAVLLSKASDPIQQLFVDKVREYGLKSKGQLFVDATPSIEKEYKDEISKAERHYGGGKGVDMKKFPDFKFSQPKIEIN